MLWITNVKAPKSVEHNAPFTIEWTVWYLGWPRTIYTGLTEDGVLLIEWYKKIWWFWGRTTKAVNISGITKDTTFVILAGY